MGLMATDIFSMSYFALALREADILYEGKTCRSPTYVWSGKKAGTGSGGEAQRIWCGPG